MAEPTTPDVEESENEESGGMSFQRMAILGSLAFVLVYVLIFIIGVIIGIAFGEGGASWLNYVTNLLIVGNILSTMMIFVGLGILIIQIARFVNLLRSEIKPITRDTKESLKNVRATTQFIKEQGVAPIIQTQSFIAGLLTFLREIVYIVRVLRRQQEQPTPEEPTQET